MWFGERTSIQEGFHSWSGGASETEDPNKDGVNNLMAYALGLEYDYPAGEGMSALPKPKLLTGNLVGMEFEISQTRPRDVSYQLEVSPTPDFPDGLTTVVAEFSTEALDWKVNDGTLNVNRQGDRQLIEVIDLEPLNDSPLFIRLKVIGR